MQTQASQIESIKGSNTANASLWYTDFVARGTTKSVRNSSGLTWGPSLQPNSAFPRVTNLLRVLNIDTVQDRPFNSPLSCKCYFAAQVLRYSDSLYWPVKDVVQNPSFKSTELQTWLCRPATIYLKGSYWAVETSFKTLLSISPSCEFCFTAQLLSTERALLSCLVFPPFQPSLMW